ncbi:M43 family zinc metalloprotease [Hymenobacter properus]|uniref:T9SS type A sorting domain-containing protein n=1 Tax=Hymenobacter properus TaxID=2791026 RepID=A0A931BHW5_9BACT|nr:M43 family zinc metalloprotease [Hymenobacter properus]MBF9142577.1 T9SS type A sorting domain-containing protein [Hymenobacter properus]MBR7721384.1 T9SS type A sorting domain-containing protein [Microvirga sp. SRT04]
MKKTYLSALALLGSAGTLMAQDVASRMAPSVKDDVTPVILRRSCASHDVLQAQLAADPGLAQRMAAIEAQTQRFVAARAAAQLRGGNNTGGSTGGSTSGTTSQLSGIVTIPVVVHVVYNTAAENIKDEQIQSQIDVLNEDFQKNNAERNNTYQYSNLSVATPVQFVLAQVIRKATKTRSWSTNDAVKSSKRGGDDALDASKYLNLWSCNLGNGLLGYAQFPGGAPATDGVVILYSAFGSRAKFPGGTYTTTYDLGRTATHEVGHWMNLRHIWGDDSGACTGSDQVLDTPNQGAENYGCPAVGKASCNNGGDMYMNYMDYTDDRCMFMFSQGQSDRMTAIFNTGGARSSFAAASGALRQTATSPALSFFPNPGREAVSLTLPAGADAAAYSVRVYDMRGYEMRQARYSGTGELNVAALPKGIYYISIGNGATTTRQRFEKE